MRPMRPTSACRRFEFAMLASSTPLRPALPRSLAGSPGADLVYLPGGDPDAVVEILAGTLAWRSVQAARSRGAAVAGASAGAMALGERMQTRHRLVARAWFPQAAGTMH